MKQGLCWCIFVLDRSGSMTSIRDDMIGGFNSFIKSQREAGIKDCRIFVYQFDTEYENVFDGVDINSLPDLSRNTYIPRGSTALYDSLGKTIVDIGKRLSDMSEEERPEKVLVVTITDGEDNSHLYSKTEEYKPYTSTEIKEMIQHQTEKYNWEFAYIGANQDAWAVGSSMGYQTGTTLNYAATAAGTAFAFDKLSRSATKYMSSTVGSKGFSFNDDDNNDEK